MRHQDGRVGRTNLVIAAILAAMALGADDPNRSDPDRREIMLPGLTRPGPCSCRMGGRCDLPGSNRRWATCR